MGYLIKNGLIVSPSKSFKSDILVEEEKILDVGENLSIPGGMDAEIIDASGKYIFPGFIDTHTHFDLDAGDFHTADDFYTGSRAAVSGGTTVVLDFTTQDRGHSLKEALDVWHGMADNRSFCDYGFHMSITDWNEESRAEIKDMTKLGVTSYKLYMTYDNLMVSDEDIFEILQAVEEEKGIIGVHCENGGIIKAITKKLKSTRKNNVACHPLSRPPEAEAEAVNRLLTIAKLACTPVNIVHLSSRLSLEVVKRARQNGQQVFVETCPQYLLLDDSLYDLPGFEGAKYVCAPPLRKKEDSEKLWEAIASNEVDMIGTDHCSFNMDGQKTRGQDDFTRIPGGVPGVEHRPVLFYTYGVKNGKVSIEKMCEILSSRPAKLFGMYPQKGVIQPASDADIVIWDPDKQWTITAKDQLQNVDNTPYEGMKVTGMAKTVFLRGQIVSRDRKIYGKPTGKYVHRAARQI